KDLMHAVNYNRLNIKTQKVITIVIVELPDSYIITSSNNTLKQRYLCFSKKIFDECLTIL
ncbi:hypothetical protein, partial [Candidatus Liberibacter americanus]|uniref:hypothetical protein n=1 Tax=Candidatus Liberibacter americanus TaxID=309868 RepID=UPI0005895065